MDPFTLALTLAPQAFKAVSGFNQARKAEKLGVQDTTTPAEREALALARQRASAQLPGTGQALNRIEAGTNDTLSAAARAGTSSNSILGLLGVADQNRQQALAGLDARSDAYQQQQQRALEGELQRKAAHELRDRETFDRNRGALMEASARNIYGAIDGAAQIGAFAASKYEPKTYTGEGQLNSALVKAAGKKVVTAPGTEATGIDDVLKPKRRYNQFGIEDPTGFYSA